MEELSKIQPTKNGEDKSDTTQSSDWSGLDVRSAEVQQIIGRPPHWLVRGGITSFMGLLILVFLAAWFIQYPETINAPLKLTAIDAPKTLNNKINGKLVKLTKKNNTYVKQGTVLAWIESTANHEEIQKLSDQIDKMHRWLINNKLEEFNDIRLNEFSNLGKLQVHFQKFETALREFTAYLSGGFYVQKLEVMEQDLSYIRELAKKLRERKKILKQDNKLAQQEFNMQNKLSEKGLLAPMELARQKSKLLASRLPLQQIESAIINNKISETEKKEGLRELKRQITQQKSIFLQAINSLKSSIDEWKANYLIIAPLSGKVVYASILQENQTLSAGQDIFYIIPHNTQFFGELTISQHSYGKIHEGQDVLVRFNSYPHQEFGLVTGNINYLSDIPVKDSVFVGKVVFPQGLSTNYGEKLTPINGMIGNAEIVTQDMRLIERLYNNVTKQIR